MINFDQIFGRILKIIINLFGIILKTTFALIENMQIKKLTDRLKGEEEYRLLGKWHNE